MLKLSVDLYIYIRWLRKEMVLTDDLHVHNISFSNDTYLILNIDFNKLSVRIFMKMSSPVL